MSSPFCASTIDADGGCTAWTNGEPWPWHGCSKPEAHAGTGGRSKIAVHVCKCNIAWNNTGDIIDA